MISVAFARRNFCATIDLAALCWHITENRVSETSSEIIWIMPCRLGKLAVAPPDARWLDRVDGCSAGNVGKGRCCIGAGVGRVAWIWKGWCS